MSQWDSVRRTFERVHSDLFESTLYDAEFFSYTNGTYDSGEITGKSRISIGEINVEIVPPATDTTIDIDGTDLSFSTSIRFPLDFDDLVVADGETVTINSSQKQYFETVTVESGGTVDINGLLTTTAVDNDGTINVQNGTLRVLDEGFVDSITPPGEDVDKPSEVEITDNIDNSTEIYQAHAYSEEKGSGMVMIRLEEL